MKKIILPDRLRLQRFVIHAIPQWSEPNQSDTMEPSLHRSGRALRIDRSQILQTLKFYSWPRHMADSKRYTRVD